MPRQISIECPFCMRSVAALKYESYLQTQRTRIFAGTKYIYQKKPKKVEILEPCSNCGKSIKEIQKAYNTGITKNLSHTQRLKRLKKAGLPTKILSKRE